MSDLMNKNKFDIEKFKFKVLFLSTIVFGTFGITSAFIGLLINFLGFKELSELCYWFFVGGILLSIISLYLFNKVKDQ